MTKHTRELIIKIFAILMIVGMVGGSVVSALTLF